MEEISQKTNNHSDTTDEEDDRPQYTMAGILHYLQHEWTKRELEKTRWEAERAELQARISFLQGERRGQENLKVDLVRRIKMLEYCLKQERAKTYRLTHNGEEPPCYDEPQNENAAPSDSANSDIDAYTSEIDGAGNWKQSRLLLKRYLEEMGYSEHIMDVRSFRVKNLLGLIAPTDLPTSERSNGKKGRLGSESDDGEADGAQLDADATEALDEFSFLKAEKDTKNESDEWFEKGMNFESLVQKYQPKVKKPSRVSEDGKDLQNEVHKKLETDIPIGIASAMNAAMKEGVTGRQNRRRSDNFGFGPANEINAALGLPPDDNIDIKDESYADQDDPSVHPMKWSMKYALRSHLDSINAMQFHPVEPVVFTASDDGVVKLWNFELKREDKHGGMANGDQEPVYTFRGHFGPVLCLVLSPTGDQLFTGGRDGLICCWNVPPTNGDPYEAYDPRVLSETINGHSDAVWSVAYHSSNNRLVSASADSTLKLWEPGNGEPLIRTIEAPRNGLIPTSVDFVSTETSHLLVAYTNCFAQIVDIETGNPVMVFDFGEALKQATLNKIISHPTMPISIVASEDRTIRYFDNASGQLISSSLAHVEGVSALAIDPNGLYLISGSHDGSLRMWNFEKIVCLQEISAHRKKNDSSVTCVAFHPSRSLIGSAGADAIYYRRLTKLVNAMGIALQGQVALVTGASRGLGRGIALQLGSSGATVYITGRRPELSDNYKYGLRSLESTANEITKLGGKGIAVYVDHSSMTEVKYLFDKIASEQDGRLDILVNNVCGSANPTEFSGQRFYEMDPSIWDSINDVGLRNHYFCCVYAARMMVKRNCGLIVNVASLGGIKYLFNVAHGAGKEALIRMSADMAVELNDQNVCVVSLIPGPVRTESVQQDYFDEDGNAKTEMPGYHLFAKCESAEFTGKAIVRFSLDPARMKKTGKTLFTEDLAQKYEFKDTNGMEPQNIRSVKTILEGFGKPEIAKYVPPSVKIPKWNWAMLNWTVKTLLGFIFSVIFFSGLVANVLVVIPVFRLAFKKEKNTIFTISFVNISSDIIHLLLASFYLGPSIIYESYLLADRKDSFATRFIGSIFMFCWYIGNINQIIMALNRFLVIYYHNHLFFNQRNIYIIYALTFIFAFVKAYLVQFGFPCCAFILDHETLSYSYNIIEGVTNWSDRTDIPLNFLSTAIPTVCYTLIVHTVRKTNQTTASIQRSFVLKKRRNKEIAYTIQFCLINLFYTLAWIFIRIFPVFMMSQSINWFVCIALFNSANSCANAFVYLICNKDIQQTFRIFGIRIFKRVTSNGTSQHHIESVASNTVGRNLSKRDETSPMN
ncbi:unnamed protein product [Caenorhabditis bovis]|uniref:G-protein coupled receptors family 1 profile domain-containing protein n=1 Tax=Caenorhabditis bovis TaxID=2654633 RepID=A0A8S1EA91_9PELO|nr:unnamed protein product [Caenorhabditis bovis]